ncbi:MAG TPA: hypothetical protein VFM28_10930 [Nitrososphaeraceae archaeon]|nr:hypothetical protein [Nitrososphaeraceae archaeon]
MVSSNIICATYSSIPNFSAICEGSLSNIISIVKPLVCNNSTNPFGISRYSNLSSFQIAIFGNCDDDNDDNDEMDECDGKDK